jgi:DNA-binding winged helix-turn-helix (wHTH) protein/tetratricopeptide (TPR) repeat protein
LLRFGVFELNLDAEELHKSGTVIKLPPQSFRLLAVLASQAGQVVSRDEIQKQLWYEETFVDFEHGVNRCINQIRNVLGDDADNPLYIETLPRRGYRFVAPVVSTTVAAPRPRVVESESGEQGRVLVLTGGGTGAAAAKVVALSHPAVVPDIQAPAKPAPEVVDIRLSGFRLWRILPVWIGAAAVLIALIGGGIYWRTRKAPVLTEKDTIVLGDFDNKTGDPVWDDTLKQALEIQLRQSPFLDVIPDSKVNQTLRLMGRHAGDLLTPEVTREICQRTNSKAMLTGSIAASGSQYVIYLKAVNCDTGEQLAEAQKQVAGKEAVLKALDTEAVDLRSQLGESLISVQKYATPLAEATTTSLDALKAYSLGQKMYNVKGETASLPLFKLAVELDPNFALAYSAMSTEYGDLSEMSRAAESARKAYELREKVSNEHERLPIEANYYLYTTGELEKAAQVYELWQTTYPRDAAPSEGLTFTVMILGNREKALEEAREALRLRPNDQGRYVNLASAYMTLNRLDEAAAVVKQAEQLKLESEDLTVFRYQLAFLEGDTAQMAHLASGAMGKPGMEEQMLAFQSDTEGWRGKLKNARELTRRAVDSARRNDAKETAATYQAAAALREVEAGNREQARADADAALKLAQNRDVRAIAALALARAGDIAAAEKLAAELDKTFPLDTLVQKYWLPAVRAAIALRRNQAQRAVDLLQKASTIELGMPTNFNVVLCPAYLRGEAYLTLHHGAAAAAEFQKFIDHYGLVSNFSWGALARLGLARAYGEEGNTGKARAAYQDFLTLWKDADPDVPIYQRAKAEYAKLQ